MSRSSRNVASKNGCCGSWWWSRPSIVLVVVIVVLLVNGIISHRGLIIFQDAVQMSHRHSDLGQPFLATSKTRLDRRKRSNHKKRPLHSTTPVTTSTTPKWSFFKHRPRATDTTKLSNNNNNNNNDNSIFLSFDPHFVLEMTLPSSTSISSSAAAAATTTHQTVQVGRQANAVRHAILQGLPQRMTGHPRAVWDIIATSQCLTTTTNNNNNNNTPKAPPVLSNTTFTTTQGMTIHSNNNNNNNNNSMTKKQQSSKRHIYPNLPQAILLGVQKGGTTALYQYLDKHPNVANSKKELYFLDEQVDQMILQQHQHQHQHGTSSTIGIPQHKARSAYSRVMTQALLDPVDPHLHQSHHPLSVPIPGHNNIKSSNTTTTFTTTTTAHSPQMVLDLTPNYLFQSDRLPQRIACIVPWVKLLVLLRNPIDRARSQYDMKMRFIQPNVNIKSNGYTIPTLEEYIWNDIHALQETGVLQDWTQISFDDYWDTPAMWEAWRTYLNSGLNAPIGMGLYALQLLPFINVLGHSKMLVLQSEHLQQDTNATYQRVLQFLELPPYSLPSYPRANRATLPLSSSSTSQQQRQQRQPRLSKNMTKMLQELFEPFNQKLVELLGEEWDGVWTN